MRNTKSVLNLFVMAGLGLSLGLLTACGGSDSAPAPAVTTLPNCTANSVYNQSTKKWSLSAKDTKECKAITTVPANVTCSANQVKVRIPVTNKTNAGGKNLPTGTSFNPSAGQQTCIQQSNGQIVCGSATTQTNNSLQVNNNTNYHTSAGSYEETCLDQNSPEWYYIVNAGSYYYLNYSLAYNHYQNYQYQYQYSYNKQLSPKETIITFGVLAAALFFLSN